MKNKIQKLPMMLNYYKIIKLNQVSKIQTNKFKNKTINLIKFKIKIKKKI